MRVGKFIRVLAAALVAAPAPVVLNVQAASGADDPVQAAPFQPLSREQRQRLFRALEPWHARYDPAERMLREPFRSPGYHSTLQGGWVHPTRSSLQYAVALLDTGQETLRQRAEDVLRRVIALQDQEPTHQTYGIWSWFLEEPLAQMSPPDWNWADFCGVLLLQVARHHRERLSPEVARQVDDAIRHAARSIQRRNVGPGYTNIAIMGSYVTLIAAELYDWPEMKQYALERWRRFYDYTRQHGAFTEYNSPTYTVVALKELGRMRLHARDAEARRMTEELYHLAWREIAEHFHPPSRQWAGPHSRCYSTLLGGEALALIERGTAGRVRFGVDQPALDEARLPLPCPRELEPFFKTLRKPRDLRRTFVKSDPPVIGTTYLTPEFTLGSANRGDFWNQRRALVAYWGSARKPAYLHLRLLHDGYDFSAGQFFSVQRGGDVLAAVNFALDGGDRHVSLDRIKDGVFQARDLRLRFEFGGAASMAEVTAIDQAAGAAAWRFGRLRVQALVPHVEFGGHPVRWETGGDQTKQWLDLVLWHAEQPTRIDLGQLPAAAAALAVRLAASAVEPPAVRVERRADRLQLKWNSLRLDVPVRPARAAELQKDFHAEIAAP